MAEEAEHGKTVQSATEQEENSEANNESSTTKLADALGVKKVKKSADIEKLEEKINYLQLEVEKRSAQAEEYKEQRLHALADVENMRRKALRDIDNARKFALEKFVVELLPVLDSIEHARQAVEKAEGDSQLMLEGILLTEKMFLDTVQKFNVEQINPIGELFNSDQQEALSLQPSKDVEPNTVLTVVQKGYLLNGRVIRAARVIVAKEEG